MCIIPMHVQKYVYTYEHVIPIARQRTVPESTSINLPPPPLPLPTPPPAARIREHRTKGQRNATGK